MNIVMNKKAEILDSTGTSYDISICVITYNKEKYIRDTIESILMQETTCSYEIVVGDNASTDGTRSILREYWHYDSDKFSIILNDVNIGLTANIYNAMMKAKGKYIAVLYGDDYWIAKDRLQKQFNFLEQNANFVGVTSAIENRYDGQNKGFKIFPSSSMRGRCCTLDLYLSGYDFPMAGVMFRNDIFSNQRNHFRKMLEASLSIDDLSFCILLLMTGNVYIFAETMGVYRCFKKENNSNNFNTVNSIYKRSYMSIELLNKLDKLTNSTLDLSMRYGMILGSAFWTVMKGELKFKDYRKLTLQINDHSQKPFLMVKGLLRKVQLILER